MSAFKINTQFTAEELIRFSQEHPWRPHYPVVLVKRFLNELISSSAMVIDLFDLQGRAATGILIDTVANPANDACLEIIGIRTGVNPDAVLVEMAELCKRLTPERRSGFQMGTDTETQDRLLLGLGLKHHYDIYEMERRHLHGIEKPGSPEIEEATPSDVDQVYAVLCEAFKKNPDTSIPERESWGANFLRNPKSRYFVWRENGAILGFTNLIPKDENTAEINTIGVLWENRGRGIGRQLLDRALVAAIELGFKKCHLVVATANKNALGLYQRAGFKILSQQSSYRWSKEK